MTNPYSHLLSPFKIGNVTLKNRMMGSKCALQSFTLEQSMGFGLGSGLGYLLAVMLVTEADRRLRSEAIPEAFRGLPITLIYIGVLALAIYGFTGHSVIL